MQKLTRRTALGLGIAGAMGGLLPTGSRALEPAQLKAVRRTIEVNGKSASVFGLMGPDGRMGHAARLGESFRVKLENQTEAETLIHWHGLTPPVEQDGVPVLSQAPLQPGQAYDYDFTISRAGTHWMHSHVGLQEQQMLAAPLIIHETEEPLFEEQNHVVMFHDFTFRDPAEILAELQRGGGGHAMHGMDHSKTAAGAAMPAMLNDVAFDAYLANDRTLADPEVVRVEPGGTMRLRIINAAAASNMWIDLGPLQGKLIAVDGNTILPVEGSVFPLAIAQRADIRITLPKGNGSYPVLFRPEGVAQQAGIILSTPGGLIARLADVGEMAPPLDLSFEEKFRPVALMPPNPVNRTEMVMLTGGGADYAWGFNGKPMMHESIMDVRLGDRAEVMFHNMTMMAHPMHLHGHYFKVVAVNNRRIDGPIRDTILIPPMQTVTIMFDADNPGTWAFHCHHLYHMNSGMMGTLNYVNAA